MPCYWSDTYQRFGRTCCVYLHGKCYPRIFLIGFPSFRLQQDLHTAQRTRPVRNRKASVPLIFRIMWAAPRLRSGSFP